MSRRIACVLAYDISDDASRRKLASFLLDYGDRMQYSLFEAELTEADIRKILARASELLGPDDSFRIYALCADCARRIHTLGRTGPCGTDDLIII